jgi:membrane protease YdiL (CAAX protease family)
MSDTRELSSSRDPGPTAPEGGGIVGFIRRRPLTSYLVWFFTIGQALAFTPVVADAYDVDVHPQLFIIASTVIGLLLPAVVITRIIDGPAGVRALWRRSIAVWVSLRWYALALAGLPVLATALAIAVYGMPTADLTTSSVLSALAFGLVVHTVVSLVPNNWAEEVAWMGFFQSRLQSRGSSAVRAALITGPLFAVQHVALVYGGGMTAVILMAVLIVFTVPFRMVMAWAYNRTGSLFLVGVLHAVGNGVAAGAGFGSGAGLVPRLYPDGGLVAGLIHLIAFAVISLIVLITTRGRLGLRRQANHRPSRKPVPSLEGQQS